MFEVVYGNDQFMSFYATYCLGHNFVMESLDHGPLGHLAKLSQNVVKVGKNNCSDHNSIINSYKDCIITKVFSD